MHWQGCPGDSQKDPRDGDVVVEVKQFFCERLKRLINCGVSPEQVILDPGIGFGKNPRHNLELLGALGKFVALGRPVLVGVSRKSFMGTLTGAGLNARLPASLACACLAPECRAPMTPAPEGAGNVQAVPLQAE